MAWTVTTHDDFDPEFDALSDEVRDELLAAMLALSERGPSLGRPLIDTLNAKKMKNLKEIRFRADDGVWRFAFAFDPKQQAIVLCGGDKSGVSEARFYKALVRKAEARFAIWIAKEKD
jgi:hypothetical protein